MKLYDYYRSSAAYRVRIALNLKAADYRQQPVNLLDGEQRGAAFRQVNPLGVVPCLELDDGARLYQSLAICEYLEETIPAPPLLPRGATARAHVRSLANLIACDIHPLNNLVTLRYLVHELGVDEASKLSWYRHWIERGLRAFETTLAGAGHDAPYCYGDTPSLADVCLVPQLYNARRFDCTLDELPILLRIDAHCAELDAFARAHPSRQPDAPAAAQ